jgi:hypothetical protein
MKKKDDVKKSRYGLLVAAVWALSVVVFAAGFFLFHRPRKEAMQSLERQYNESNDQVFIARKAARGDVRDQLQQKLQDAEEAVRQFSVPRESTNGLVFEIGKIANELELTEFSSKNQSVQNLSTADKKEKKELTEAWLKVEFKASFLQFARFINRLERQTPTVFVEKMTLLRNDADPTRNVVRMELSFLVRQEDKELALADAAVTEQTTSFDTTQDKTGNRL